MASPGVVLSSKFVTSSSQGFASYLKYMKRSEAVRTNAYSEYNFAFDDIKARDFDQYNQYMSNPEKTSALFNENSNQLKLSELAGVVEQFQIAEKNHSLMWQHVISFDNAWLEKFGQYNQETHELNSEVVMKATRAAMTELMNREGMEGAVWTGAIHYNTDNIHVHVVLSYP
ncbi:MULTISPECIES: relaxase MobL [unclassified Lactococcus]|uniref:relaxase MobL n=1 Tax=unclassified Lactococcus TaxID=2643510 RepID=UPI0011C9FE4D|nr:MULTISPECIES: relaxase MobL [unclassified Lactococcus]MQW24022.1 hypothetical protein [Lactococcus sp. dk101]TXK36609.1 hypothetical protein FVP42_11055 [Lactococcus sp. dk310]TXK46921.1 hypothetical protein FVP43_10660 [Lactococcus sp. dk322]